MSELGKAFTKARESLGISLNQIAQETRISTRFLQAIESEDFKQLPGGIFNRGFIRTYAKRLGLDPDKAVAEYDHLVRPREVELNPDATHPKGERKGMGVYAVVAAALVGLTVVVYVSTREATTPPVSSAPTPNVVQPQPAPQAPPLNVPQETSVAAASEPPKEPIETTTAPQQVAIEVSAHEKTWMKVTVDGGPAVEVLLEPGAMRKFTAQTTLDVTVGNAGGISLKVNDREVGAMGKSGQVRTFMITRENAQAFTGPL